MSKAEKLNFDEFEVVVDPENLRFDEDSLNNYIQKEAGFYDNFGAYLALSERNLQNKEVQHEKLYSERFVEAKEEGATEKLAEAKAKCDPDVVDVKLEIVEARYIVNRLKNHLKAWDKSHDNAQSMGHMLRKQMDKINGDIMGKHSGDRGVPGLDKVIEETVKPFEDKSNEFETDLSAENLF